MTREGLLHVRISHGVQLSVVSSWTSSDRATRAQFRMHAACVMPFGADLASTPAASARAAFLSTHHVQRDLQRAQLEGRLAGAKAQLLAVDAARAVQALRRHLHTNRSLPCC